MQVKLKSELNQNHSSQAKLVTNKSSVSLYKIVTSAVYIAWYFAAAFTIYLGYIPFGHTQLTFLPAILTISILHLGFFGSLVSGLGFGFSSFIAAYILGIIKYQNFDISVIPRFLTSILVYLIYLLLKTHKNPKLWKVILMAFFAVFFNIILTLSAQYFHHHYIAELKGILPVKEWIITHPVNLIGEPIICIIVATALYPIGMHLRKKYKNLKLIMW
ncbi:hypothetical protein [Mycoplasmopsis opalescens]|uniref:hypothetical protein n=1 Tax=Mycoplasmopsis opalescens TaxID=114886 RepID=UPI00068C8F45|nr:hypothetical protein [Mycoplasmopsis opalescens]